MNEIQIIQKFYKGKYPQDDCFFDGERLYTTDSLVEGTHFLHTWSSPKQIAQKLVEVNLSDILSSGGIAEFGFLNLGLSKFSQKKEWLLPFIKHLQNTLKLYKIQLVGGDSFYSEKTYLSLTLVSKKQKNPPVTRKGAKVNEYLYITGPIGYSYLGYKLLKFNKKPTSKLEKLGIQKHLAPKSRWDLFYTLKKFSISSMMDITDGLIQDLGKLSLCSQIGFCVFVENLPLFEKLHKYLSIEEILSSGEELELLFTSNQKINHSDIYYIGYCIQKRKLNFLYKQKNLSINKNLGFEHFS